MRNKTIIIAEAGGIIMVFKRAKNLIAAKDVGADFVKFQTLKQMN